MAGPDGDTSVPLRIYFVMLSGFIADHMKRAGHRFEVVDSVEAAISVLVVWGVARGMAVQ